MRTVPVVHNNVYIFDVMVGGKFSQGSMEALQFESLRAHLSTTGLHPFLSFQYLQKPVVMLISFYLFLGFLQFCHFKLRGHHHVYILDVMVGSTTT